VDDRNNDPFAVVSRSKGYGVQARLANLQLAFTCGPS